MPSVPRLSDRGMRATWALLVVVLVVSLSGCSRSADPTRRSSAVGSATPSEVVWASVEKKGPEVAGPISMPMGSEPFDSSQPPEVRRILGEDFENLTGEQVQTVDGVQQLVATKTYGWPADSCGGTREEFVPQVCPPAQGQLQGDNLKEAMGELMGAIGQGRLCELWQLALRSTGAGPPPRGSSSGRSGPTGCSTGCRT